MRLTTAVTIFLGLTSMAAAAETVVKDGDKQTLNITVYNQNLALVKDVRNVDLKKGINDIAFEGVASGIKPETAILYAQDIKVLEQNYDYDILDLNNIIEKSVGKTIKTLKINPATGEKIFDTAKIISFSGNTPILEFSYGIDADFDGQLLFEDLPAGLRRKPTLVAKIYSNTDNSGDLSLAYLTNGISWRANYVANVIDNTKLNLTAWVTINNESGIDYNNANVQLVAGQINQTRNNSAYRGEMRAMALAAPKMAMADGFEMAQEDISAYHLYTLPDKTTIKDKQTKQITLMERNAIKYTKEAELTSPLHFYPNSNIEFKNQHLSMYYNLVNDTASNLGVQLPAGTIRFYENDKQGNLQFIGENTIDHTAKEEKMHLYLGNYGNIFASGKIIKTTKLENEQTKTDDESCSVYYTPYAYDAEIKVYNSGKSKERIKIRQNLPQDAEITDQNIKGQSPHAGMYEWGFEVAPESNQTLSFTLKAPHIRKRTCNQ